MPPLMAPIMEPQKSKVVAGNHKIKALSLNTWILYFFSAGLLQNSCPSSLFCRNPAAKSFCWETLFCRLFCWKQFPQWGRRGENKKKKKNSTLYHVLYALLNSSSSFVVLSAIMQLSTMLVASEHRNRKRIRRTVQRGERQVCSFILCVFSLSKRWIDHHSENKSSR